MKEMVREEDEGVGDKRKMKQLVREEDEGVGKRER